MQDLAETPVALRQPDPQLDGLTETRECHFPGPDGARVAWSVWGQGAPVILLHGAHGSWQHFVRNIGHLAQDRRVLAADIPGYGASDPIRHPTHMADIAARIAIGIDALIGADTPYDLIGFSFGGGVTSELIRHHAGRQRTMVIAAPAGIAAPGNPTMVSVRHRVGDDLVNAHRANLESIMFSDPAAVTPQALRIQHEGTMQSRLPVRRVDYGPGLRETLHDFHAPLLAIWGQDDAFFAEDDVTHRPKVVRAACPHAKTEVWPGVGHWLQYEAADRFNRLVSDFLAL
jgi:pimeloyl-ACP methyl ester carboxylesterase